jgi:hypothetical protein
MVTLDDARIAPQGTVGRHRRFSWAAVVVGLALAGYLLYWFFGDGLDRLTTSVNQQVSTSESFGQQIARAGASVAIDQPADLTRSATRIARHNKRIFGSRLVVCRVADPLWQDTVRALAGVSHAVVIDVSRRPTTSSGSSRRCGPGPTGAGS